MSASPISIDLQALLFLIVANSAPVVIAQFLGNRWAARIDSGVILPDGRPLFGSHKTWRGLVAGTAATGLLGTWSSVGWLTGALFGLLALSGDLFSSFLKRRMNRVSGHWTPVLDQLPEALLPMAVLHDDLNLTARSIAGTAVIFTLLDLTFSKLMSRAEQ